MEWYKGKVSITEICTEMPHKFFYRLYARLLQKSLTEDGKKELQSKKVNDALGGLMG